VANGQTKDERGKKEEGERRGYTIYRCTSIVNKKRRKRKEKERQRGRVKAKRDGIGLCRCGSSGSGVDGKV